MDHTAYKPCFRLLKPQSQLRNSFHHGNSLVNAGCEERASTAFIPSLVVSIDTVRIMRTERGPGHCVSVAHKTMSIVWRDPYGQKQERRREQARGVCNSQGIDDHHKPG